MLIPPSLKPGNSVAVVAPSATANEADVLAGCSVLESWGLKVELGKSVFKPFGRLASSDRNRLKDLQSAMDNPEIQAIICTRGGYGLSRIVDDLNWSKFRKNPKWLVGFSDVTAWHQAAQANEIASIHGPMAVHLPLKEQQPAVLELKDFLFGKKTLLQRSLTGSTNQSDNQDISGLLTGGNLTLLVNSIGTKSQLKGDGKILFLEEIDESDYKVDRMLVHLHRSGALDGIKAIILGHFTDCNPGNFPFTVGESLKNILGDNFPVFEGMPSGHESPTHLLVLGATCEIKKQKEEWIFTQNTSQSLSS